MPTENPQDARRLEFERARRARAEEVQTSPTRVYELIRSMIRDGTVPQDGALGEADLVRHLGASRNAVRRALQMLADDGVVVRQRRAGTSVLHDIVAVRDGEVGPRAYEGAADEGRLRVSTLECRRIPVPPPVRRGLGTDATSVLLLEQVGFVGGSPLYLRVGYNVTDLSVEEFLRRIEANHVRYPPIAEVFESLFDVPYGSSSSVVEAVSCEERAAGLLGIPEGSPVLLRELMTRQTDGTPRELSFTHFRGDRVAIFGGDHSGPSVAGTAGFTDLDLPLT
ncbi:GntR family transcriptional regulator [Kineococcus rhizosphaerae]|uniref:GntR family transcriptional regulator n=1 Tax=Kineococcus rhizosphaerae TaxID=559628 RepID=A0A2T0QYB7_9ACTN|nr:GntR family transcriptional regulator [Kineococcus rhizosphaerae]PRY11186.1 GntR family transcriptional regulator [Kineococcus rhizosphaerae]